MQKIRSEKLHFLDSKQNLHESISPQKRKASYHFFSTPQMYSQYGISKYGHQNDMDGNKLPFIFNEKKKKQLTNASFWFDIRWHIFHFEQYTTNRPRDKPPHNMKKPFFSYFNKARNENGKTEIWFIFNVSQWGPFYWPFHQNLCLFRIFQSEQSISFCHISAFSPNPKSAIRPFVLFNFVQKSNAIVTKTLHFFIFRAFWFNIWTNENCSDWRK